MELYVNVTIKLNKALTDIKAPVSNVLPKQSF